ncbi:MAG: glycosidase [Chloroflexi bacterium]|nr:glycosidase [Chloroflexota bacterium]
MTANEQRSVPAKDNGVGIFAVQRLGIVMDPDPANPFEAMGVLNPAMARAPDGMPYLFPRLVAAGNYSRIGWARLLFQDGNPVGVERLGTVLEPETAYERSPSGAGGCEDPRITYIAAVQRYVMTYVAVGETGPRVAVAVSDDLVSWRRLGLLQFAHARMDFGRYGNKDASFFPEPVLDPNGHPALAIIHRPTYRQHFPDGSEQVVLPAHITDRRESIWISYVSLEQARKDERRLIHVHDNHLLLAPHAAWEDIKLGGGPPPVRIPQGWLLVYHGIRPLRLPSGDLASHGEYCAGVAVLDSQRPWHVYYRSPEPILTPDGPEELYGVVNHVIFPTGLDPRPDLGPGCIDVYYGMADTRIGAARLQVPAALPLRHHDQHATHPRAQPAPADAGHAHQPKLIPPRE